MSRLAAGATVVAVKTIRNGWTGDEVPSGALGTVAAASRLGRATVTFTWPVLLSGDRESVTLEVDDDAVGRP